MSSSSRSARRAWKHGLLAVALCTWALAPPAHGVVNGTLDTEHDSVGALVGNTLCTAVLITPTRVMTAAHCVESGPLPQFLLGVDRFNPDWVIATTGFSIHPLYTTNVEYNVALVQLAAPATGYTPVLLLRPW